MRLAVWLLTFLLVACGPTKPDLPDDLDVVELPVTKFKPLAPELTEPCPIAEGDVGEVFDVARARKESLVACNSQLDRIREIQEDIEP